MTPRERERFGDQLSAYIEASDEDDLEALVDALSTALGLRLMPYGLLAQIGLAGVRDAIRLHLAEDEFVNEVLAGDRSRRRWGRSR